MLLYFKLDKWVSFFFVKSVAGPWQEGQGDKTHSGSVMSVYKIWDKLHVYKCFSISIVWEKHSFCKITMFLCVSQANNKTFAENSTKKKLKTSFIKKIHSCF